MSERLLQINFRIGVPAAQYEEAAAQLAGAFAGVPGLRWKNWILNEAESEAGGIYLFADQASLETFLESPSGKTPFNVIYLNSLDDDLHKLFIVNSICRAIRLWIYRGEARQLMVDGKPASIFITLDEAGPYIPAGTKTSPSKDNLSALFKEGRKFGVCLMYCTQNITDVDYKVMDQAKNKFFGRTANDSEAAY